MENRFGLKNIRFGSGRPGSVEISDSGRVTNPGRVDPINLFRFNNIIVCPEANTLNAIAEKKTQYNKLGNSYMQLSVLSTKTKLLSMSNGRRYKSNSWPKLQCHVQQTSCTNIFPILRGFFLCSSMASSSNTNDDFTVPLEEMDENLNLNGADGCLEYHEPLNPNSASGLPWSIVCRILTEKPMTVRFFQDAMAQAWMPGKCMTMKDLGNNCFLIQFYHERDFTRVMSNKP
ncbi:hypothetical protein RND71_002235 [Anisodus tanguticus]|uniref:DUF4283 domain-containing protein n=1 Tax=Anisodus tanguticus TaxID=243964 RepID=A0AAE1T2N2_9SOLA|nr:hypothetical protein RND71_002235 [Anisodus tanguticus]